MIITAAQLDKMNQLTEESFQRKVMAFAVKQKKAEAIDLDLQPACARLIEMARSYGFSTELEIAAFTICGFTYGPAFLTDQTLPFHQLLHDRQMHPATKADVMIKILECVEDAGDAGSRA